MEGATLVLPSSGDQMQGISWSGVKDLKVGRHTPRAEPQQKKRINPIKKDSTRADVWSGTNEDSQTPEMLLRGVRQLASRELVPKEGTCVR